MANRIIVPLDGSDRAAIALDPARSLGERLGCPVTVLSSVESRDEPERRAAVGRQLVSYGLPADTDVLVSAEPDVAALIAVTASHHRSIVCMSTHGRTGLGRAILGSVAESAIAHSTDAGFLLVGPQYQRTPDLGRAVLLAVDGGSHAAVAGQWARDLALALRVPLWVVSVLQPGTPTPNGVEQNHVENVARALGADGGPEVDWDVLHRHDPADA
ncbi:MAG: universal stress protein, partial [Acidimicrobiales bacterium]|nr:universal stress protein [Acidimicrobiales bacterium]